MTCETRGLRTEYRMLTPQELRLIVKHHRSLYYMDTLAWLPSLASVASFGMDLRSKLNSTHLLLEAVGHNEKRPESDTHALRRYHLNLLPDAQQVRDDLPHREIQPLLKRGTNMIQSVSQMLKVFIDKHADTTSQGHLCFQPCYIFVVHH